MTTFNMDCNNRGCGKTQTPFLDKDTNKVYCSACHKEIENVSPFVKNTMRMNKQFRVKEKKSFSVKCACGNEDRPVIEDDKIVCAECGAEQKQLTPQYATMLKDKLGDVE